MPTLTRSFVHCVLFVAACLATCVPCFSSEPFRYDDTGDKLPRPRFHNIQTGLPGGIERDALLWGIDPTGTSKWNLGWFVYGAQDSRSIAIGFKAGTPSQLYVDLNRDKTFQADERINADDPGVESWQTKIDAEFVTESGDFETATRSIRIRRLGDEAIQIATTGVMRGQVEIGGTSIAAIRMDRDSNGRWFDAADRIVLDLNGDGKVDSIGGRVACESITRLFGKRYVLKSDQVGTSIEFDELVGTGSIAPHLPLKPSVELSKFNASLVSRGGVRVALEGLEPRDECPVGHYRIESLSFEVTEADEQYEFFFYGSNQSKYPFEVSDAGSTKVDLLGELKLGGGQTVIPRPDGAMITINPSLTTTSGLYMTDCKAEQRENRLLVRARHGDHVFATASSGFS